MPSALIQAFQHFEQPGHRSWGIFRTQSINTLQGVQANHFFFVVEKGDEKLCGRFVR